MVALCTEYFLNLYRACNVYDSSERRQYLLLFPDSSPDVTTGTRAPSLPHKLPTVSSGTSSPNMYVHTLSFNPECRLLTLTEQVNVITMDNASNCDTTARELGKLIPTFRGRLARGRCFAHTVQLVVKVSSINFSIYAL